MDLKLTDHDLDITNGELSFVTGAVAIGQDIKMALRTFLGEVPFYDESVGVPYTQVIFRGKNPNLDANKFILESIIRRRPGVIGVLSLTLELDRTTRELSVNGTVETIDGEIDFSEIIEATP